MFLFCLQLLGDEWAEIVSFKLKCDGNNSDTKITFRNDNDHQHLNDCCNSVFAVEYKIHLRSKKSRIHNSNEYGLIKNETILQKCNLIFSNVNDLSIIDGATSCNGSLTPRNTEINLKFCMFVAPSNTNINTSVTTITTALSIADTLAGLFSTNGDSDAAGVNFAAIVARLDASGNIGCASGNNSNNRHEFESEIHNTLEYCFNQMFCCDGDCSTYYCASAGMICDVCNFCFARAVLVLFLSMSCIIM